MLVPIITKNSVPKKLINNPQISCVVGLVVEPSRLLEVRKNRMTSLSEERPSSYIDLKNITQELEIAKDIFKRHNWPTIDVTRKSVEETAASVIKIYDIIHS